MSYSVTIRSTPNQSARNATPIYLVIHQTIGGFDGSVAWLQNSAAQASADEVISRDGTRVVQLVSDIKMKSWEVGNANPLCYGFELEDVDADLDDITDEQLATMADRMKVVQRRIKSAYGITIPLRPSTGKGVPGIVSHKQIAAWYGGSNHTDGGVPFARFASYLGDGEIGGGVTNDPQPTKAEWRLARWYFNLAEFKDHGRKQYIESCPPDQTRPRLPLTDGFWRAARWYQDHLPDRKDPS